MMSFPPIFVNKPRANTFENYLCKTLKINARSRERLPGDYFRREPLSPKPDFTDLINGITQQS
jgi:hypothetical protein